MIFFQPTQDWINWLIDYTNNRIIIDIGCGEGELLKQLYMSGYSNIVGVDMFIRDELKIHFHKMGTSVHLWEMDTTESTYLRKLMFIDGNKRFYPLFLFCRPCHGGFVEYTLPNLPIDAEVLYIGKPMNLHMDIPDTYKYIELNTPPLQEEKTYRIVRA